ncbi:hypothetical protein ACFYT3_14890 [Nocardia amikacinitolerans]|uniref:hypothetical protein n=1 Tax=Nocardia amikacinitolerans TaxID=756689 RepID=UPI0020A27184|nr:hypothetical protein [Nocardia amikacinitolerans]MCP2292787.1 hypothetical protein [Nocardia amikacinitolerans]
MHRVAGWWDGFELWVAGLPFIPQFLVVLVGMVPVSFAIAYLLDRALRATLQLLGRDSRVAELADVAVLAEPAPVLVEESTADRRPVQSGAR